MLKNIIINNEQRLCNRVVRNILTPNVLVPITVFSASMTLMTAAAVAAAPVEFTHQDWQVACDNTHTCRLAGYQAENNSELPVSVLLIRRAGSNAEVIGKVKLGGAKESAAKSLMQLGNRHRISLFINDKDFGETKPFSTTSGDAELTATQVSALLEALSKSSKIELVVRNTRWLLSDKGATAVMLKADEAQGRVGTSSAFISKNNANGQIVTAKPAPELRLVIPQSTTSASSKKFAMRASTLAALMKSTLKDVSSDCPNLTDKTPWQVTRLNDSQLLLQHNCWVGAYNVGDGMWVINDRKPYDPTLVTTSASAYNDKGTISAIQKGRGIGDCLSKTEWVWTGNRFSKSYEGTTGLCRIIEVGGAWDLPTYVTQVKTSS